MKNLRKIFSATLVVIMLLMVFAPAISAADYTQEVPHIDFKGFMSYTIYKDKDDPDSEKAFPPSTKTIIETAAGLVPALSKLAYDGNWDKFGDSFISVLNNMLAPIGYDENGEAQYNTGVHFTYPTKEELIENGLEVDFQYDWRADPYKSAAELNDLITYLTEELGYPQVTLESHSYAGIVMLTYLSTYGTSKIKSCCFNATAVFGAQFAGELVKGNVTVSEEALTQFLMGLFDHNEYEAIIAALIEDLSKAGITGFLAEFATALFDNLSDRIWTECILPALGHWPSIWAMVPDTDYEEGYNNVFGNLYADSNIDFSGLHAKMERFNGDIRKNREAKLTAVNDTTNMYVIARYGYSGVPLGNIWISNTDTILTASAESFGATCKNYNEIIKLDDPERYISPNGAVDASTCLFPDQTWFIRNCKHTQKEESIVEFAKTLLYNEGQATIDSFEEYPQYLLYTSATEDLIDDNNSNPVRNLRLSTIINILRNVLVYIRNYFKDLKK